jgi:hypothetical protein
MTTSRDVRATTAGVMFIIATVAALLTAPLLGSLLDGDRFLAAVAAHQTRLQVAALLQIIAALSIPAIAIALYPVLRQRAAAMALGSVGFRLIEGVFMALSAAGTLVLVAMSDQLATADTTSAAATSSANLVRDLRDSAGCVSGLAFCTGATLYYVVFYRSQLIPRWLSGWGLIGTGLGFLAELLVLFQVIGSLSGQQMALNIPIAVQEMVFAGWLIWKGFNVPETPPAPTMRSESLVGAAGRA